MPYNNTAIPPPEKVTGQTSLPLARIKRILQQDDELGPCSNSAAFVITLATEMFIRYMAEQAHNVSKAEAKPRRNVQYKDLANAVARLDNLEFLSDVVPRTTTYREYRRQKAEKQASKSAKAAEAGQTTLDGKRIGGLPDRHASLDLSQLTEDPASPLSPDRRPPPHANRHEGPSQIESSLPIHYGNLGQGSGQQLETNGVPREGPDRDTEMREVYY